jgi:cytochrome c oxidase cbb3-type subunit 2
VARETRLPVEELGLDMAYRLRSGVELLIVRGPDGVLRHHYAAPHGGVNIRGPYIPWLNDEQRECFLRNGLVEEIDESELPKAEPRADAEPEPVPNGDVVGECIRDLDRLGVPEDAGAPTARAALRGNGVSYANDVIRVAIKQRKERLFAVPDSGG